VAQEDRDLDDANKRHGHWVENSDFDGDIDDSEFLGKIDVKKLEYQIKSVIFLLF
jgi:CRISPR/Cas system-associated endoribonuclease Cas2